MDNGIVTASIPLTCPPVTMATISLFHPSSNMSHSHYGNHNHLLMSQLSPVCSASNMVAAVVSSMPMPLTLPIQNAQFNTSTTSSPLVIDPIPSDSRLNMLSGLCLSSYFHNDLMNNSRNSHPMSAHPSLSLPTALAISTASSDIPSTSSTTVLSEDHKICSSSHNLHVDDVEHSLTTSMSENITQKKKKPRNRSSGRNASSMPPSHACSVCGKLFRQRHHLASHERGHSAERPFVCDQCNVGFARADSLARHQIVHTRERRYACDLCGRPFAHKYHLRSHIRTHSQEKPYHCQVCQRSFARLDSMKRHSFVHQKYLQYKMGAVDVKSEIQVSQLTPAESNDVSNVMLVENAMLLSSNCDNNERNNAGSSVVSGMQFMNMNVKAVDSTPFE